MQGGIRSQSYGYEGRQVMESDMGKGVRARRRLEIIYIHYLGFSVEEAFQIHRDHPPQVHRL